VAVTARLLTFVYFRATFFCLYRRHQNEGYINYTRIGIGDHSYAYDNSAYQDPPAHKRQKEADGAYKHRKVKTILLR